MTIALSAEGVPDDAFEVIIYAKVATGNCPDQDEDSELCVSSTIPNGQIERKVFCRFYGQQAWSYNSENISLPVDKLGLRVITAHLKGFGKRSNASVTVVGYRR